MTDELVFLNAVFEIVAIALPFIIIICFFVLVANVIKIKKLLMPSENIQKALFFGDKEKAVEALKNSLWKKKNEVNYGEDSPGSERLNKEITEILTELKKQGFAFTPAMNEWIAKIGIDVK